MKCYAINEEATPFFYREARIHFSMSWQKLPKSIDETPIRLPLLVHVSIDFCCHSLRDEYADDSERMQTWHYNPIGKYPIIEVEEAVDRQIAQCIEIISRKCPLLHSFTLHLLSCVVGHDIDIRTNILQEALESADHRSRPSYTVKSLKELKVRDTIAVVAVATPCHSPCTCKALISRVSSTYPGRVQNLPGQEMEDYLCTGMYRKIRDAIAPVAEWELRVLSEWPGINLTRNQKMGVHVLMAITEDYGNFPVGLDAEIHLWYYQPPGSKALVLPDHKLLTDELSVESDSHKYNSDEYDSHEYDGDESDSDGFYNMAI